MNIVLNLYTSTFLSNNLNLFTFFYLATSLEDPLTHETCLVAEFFGNSKEFRDENEDVKQLSSVQVDMLLNDLLVSWGDGDHVLKKESGVGKAAPNSKKLVVIKSYEKLYTTTPLLQTITESKSKKNKPMAFYVKIPIRNERKKYRSNEHSYEKCKTELFVPGILKRLFVQTSFEYSPNTDHSITLNLNGSFYIIHPSGLYNKEAAAIATDKSRYVRMCYDIKVTYSTGYKIPNEYKDQNDIIITLIAILKENLGGENQILGTSTYSWLGSPETPINKVEEKHEESTDSSLDSENDGHSDSMGYDPVSYYLASTMDLTDAI